MERDSAALLEEGTSVDKGVGSSVTTGRAGFNAKCSLLADAVQSNKASEAGSGEAAAALEVRAATSFRFLDGFSEIASF